MTRQIARQVNILGIRGVPASHGGFETFASRLAPYLVSNGWQVRVYCQHDAAEAGEHADTDSWNGVTRKHIYVEGDGPLSTIKFDWRATRDVLTQPGIDLVLGYNTAVFTLLQQARRRPLVINMDGIEWRRAKWGSLAKAWFVLNELVGARSGTVIADHPEIARHLARMPGVRPHVIVYGADEIRGGDPGLIRPYGLEPDRYLISIARVEPENFTLEMVRAFAHEQRGFKLVVLGNLSDSPYHRAVRAAANEDTVFPGAIYEPGRVSALRFHARAYMHGHQVGGTNPSLVEALGAGNAVIAHDNRYNRWTAGDGQFFFTDEASCAARIGTVLADHAAVKAARAAAKAQFRTNFRWEAILGQYRALLEQMAAAGGEAIDPIRPPDLG